MREYNEATSGMVLTDGVIFGKKILIAEGVDKNAFYEITEEEYKKEIARDSRLNW